jgi:hypothetical protein
MTPVIALIGMTGLWLLFGWLLSGIAGSYLSVRKGYGEKPGVAAGLLLLPVGVIIWLLIPARDGSAWKEEGPMPPRRGRQGIDITAGEQPAPTGPEPGSGPGSAES